MPSRRKKSFHEVWQSYGRFKQAEFIVAALVALAGLGYFVVYIIVSVQQERQTKMQHMPLVIHNRPPKLLQTFICERGNWYRTGNIQTYIKNVGDATALDVYPYWFLPKLIPEHRTGNPSEDDLPVGVCNVFMPKSEHTFPMERNKELILNMRQFAGSAPGLGDGQALNFYVVSCVYYSDEYGGHHGTCDTYALFFPSSNPLDQLTGIRSFICDGTPRTARFEWHLTGHCQK